MNTQPNPDCCPFRFRTGHTKWLTEEIGRIEALATERIHAGGSYQSVQIGSLALLKIELEKVVELSAVSK